MPLDERLRTAGAALLREPGRPETLEEWPDIAGASSRTLARLSDSGTGMRFVDRWNQARLADVLVRLARGQDVASVSGGLG
jgi:methylphosphotriester-DNA--protein-cysteine methyltransferase